MWSIIKYYLFTKNNFLMLIIFYPVLLSLSTLGSKHISSSISYLEMFAYPFIFVGFFMNIQKAVVERLPLEIERIRIAKSVALYAIIVIMCIENIILLFILGTNSYSTVASAILKINILFAIVLLLAKIFAKNNFDFNKKELIEIPLTIIPILAYIGANLYIFQHNSYMQIFLGIIFYPFFELWNYYNRTKWKLAV